MDEVIEIHMTQEEWWKIAIEKGTSGDMVTDILDDWKKERDYLLSLLGGKDKEIQRLKKKISDLYESFNDYTSDSK